MSNSRFPDPHEETLAQLHARFLALVPRIELHARIHFRHIPCPQRKADAIAETIAVAWKWFIRLAERGKDAAQFTSVMARFAACAVKSGRRVCGQEKSKDVLSSVAQQRHAFFVGPLPEESGLSGNVFDEALLDNRQTPVLDQVAFRFDFPAWLKTRTDRDRRVIADLMVGNRTMEVSRQYGLTETRISQLRREFHDDWERFTGQDTHDPQDRTERC